MSDERLRELYARATRAGTDPRHAECPRPEALEALVRREGAERQRLETLDHVMACAHCRPEFELLRAIEHGRSAETGAVVAVHWRRQLAIALGTALAAGLAFVAVVKTRPSDSPGRESSGAMRGGAAEVALTAPAADTVVSPGSLAFAWRAVPGAHGYTLEVLTPAGDVRSVKVTTDTTATISGTELGTGDLRWSVRAQMDGGELRSTTRRLRVGGS